MSHILQQKRPFGSMTGAVKVNPAQKKKKKKSATNAINKNPPALVRLLRTTLQNCRPEEKSFVKNWFSNEIRVKKASGELHTTDWAHFPLPGNINEIYRRSQQTTPSSGTSLPSGSRAAVASSSSSYPASRAHHGAAASVPQQQQQQYGQSRADYYRQLQYGAVSGSTQFANTGYGAIGYGGTGYGGTRSGGPGYGASGFGAPGYGGVARPPVPAPAAAAGYGVVSYGAPGYGGTTAYSSLGFRPAQTQSFARAPAQTQAPAQTRAVTGATTSRFGARPSSRFGVRPPATDPWAAKPQQQQMQQSGDTTKLSKKQRKRLARLEQKQKELEHKRQQKKLQKKQQKQQQKQQGMGAGWVPSAEHRAMAAATRRRFANDEKFKVRKSGPSAYELAGRVALDDEAAMENLRIRGTSRTLEKSYFRLTSAPDPDEVRPEPILRRALSRLLRLWAMRRQALVAAGSTEFTLHAALLPPFEDTASDELLVKDAQVDAELKRMLNLPDAQLDKAVQRLSYNYFIDQFKALRQDAFVQHLENAFCVQLYEANARVCLQTGDLSNFVQCVTKLKWLYRLLPECTCRAAEFTCYELVYHASIANRSGLNEAMAQVAHAIRRRELGDPALLRKALRFSVRVVRALRDQCAPELLSLAGDLASFPCVAFLLTPLFNTTRVAWLKKLLLTQPSVPLRQAQTQLHLGTEQQARQWLADASVRIGANDVLDKKCVSEVRAPVYDDKSAAQQCSVLHAMKSRA